MSQYIGKIKKLSEKVLEILSSLDENQTKHGWRNQYYHYQALQGRTEARFFYNSENLNLKVSSPAYMNCS